MPRSRRRSRAMSLVVLVVAAPPEARLIAPQRRPVEPLIHAPQTVHAAGVARVGVVNVAVLHGECADAWPFTAVGFPVRADDRFAERVHGVLLLGSRPKVLLTEVVGGGSGLPLLLRVGHAEVEVEVAAKGRRPRERPAHSLLVRVELRVGSPRHRAERDVVVSQMYDRAVEAVSDGRA